MRIFLAAAVIAAFATTAYAQETTTAAAPVAPSTCGEVPAAPTPPNGARANAEQMAAAVAQYEAWNTATTSTLQCRIQEARATRAQADARETEYNAALAAGQAAGVAWQTQVDAYQARQRR